MSDIDATDKGQVGVSTLIVFIAMILIASVTAGVLINTTTSLESQSERTGDETNDQVTARLQIVGVAGRVSGSETVTWVNLTVKAGAGSGAVDLSSATVHFLGPTGTQPLVHTNGTPTGGEYVIESLRDGDSSVPVLNDPADRASIAIHLEQSNAEFGALDPNERATIRITTAAGGSTRIRIGVPGDLNGDSSVAL